MYGWGPPTLMFASVLYCTVMLLPPLVFASRLKVDDIMCSNSGSDSGSSAGGSYHGTVDSGRCCRCNLITITPGQGRIKVDNTSKEIIVGRSTSA